VKFKTTYYLKNPYINSFIQNEIYCASYPSFLMAITEVNQTRIYV